MTSRTACLLGMGARRCTPVAPIVATLLTCAATFALGSAGCHDAVSAGLGGGTPDVGATETGPLPPGDLAPLPAARAVDHGHFATSQACADCHSNSAGSDAMRDAAGRPIAPFDLWQATMMANSARDPLFRAALAAERVATPSLAGAIEDKCLTCHSPMAAWEAHSTGGAIALATVYSDTAEGQLALDGVSCTVCHQIQPNGLGQPERFSGKYVIGSERLIYGPHAAPFERPMEMRSGFVPVAADHMRSSALCATCHTLYTDAHRPDGTPVGQRLPEQTPYLEWRNSAFSTERADPGPLAADCQGCHTPTRDVDGAPISTAIARRPDGSDFPPIGDRSPYGRHVFVGGNTLIPAILRDNAATLRPPAPAEAFDAVIAAARAQLEQRTASVTVLPEPADEAALRFSVRVDNRAGHKLPTGFPARRAWLRVTVRDAAGQAVFTSGAVDAAGRIVGPDGQPLAFERAGGPMEPHHAVVTQPTQVQLYEAVMADADGTPTGRLMHAASYAKDTRLLPIGWRDDHPDAPDTRPVGPTGDADFAGGSDVVAFALPRPAADGPFQVEVSLLYQTLGARFAAELFAVDAPEIRAFASYFEAADRTPVTLATATLTLP